MLSSEPPSFHALLSGLPLLDTLSSVMGIKIIFIDTPGQGSPAFVGFYASSRSVHATIFEMMVLCLYVIVFIGHVSSIVCYAYCV